MSVHRKVISIAIAVIMVFGSLPVHFTDYGGATEAYAAEEAGLNDTEAVAADKEWLTDEYMWGLFLGWIRDDLDLPTNGETGGSKITWSSSNEHLIDSEGKVNRPAYSGVNSYDVVLTATITTGTASDTAVFDVSVAPLFGSLAIQLDFEDIYNIENVANLLAFNGTAKKGDPYISNGHLFSINNNGAGSIFTKNKIQLADDLSFSTYFIFDINSMYFKYDEGFTFTLQADSNAALGTGGPSSIGAIDISPSLSVEFDTKKDSEGADYEYQGSDADHHIAAYTNGKYQEPIAIAPAAVWDEDGTRDFSANQKFKVWIQYDGTEKKLEVFEAFANSDKDPADPVISVDLDLANLFKSPDGKIISDVYAGFTGHGSEYNVSPCVYQWRFKNDPFPIEYDLPPFSYQNLYKDASNVSLATETIDSEGAYASTITAVIKDLSGKPVSEVPVTLNTDFGVLDSSSEITDRYGCVNVTLTSEAAGTALVRATAQGGAYAEAQAFLIVTDEAKLDKDYNELTPDRLLNGNTSLNFVRWDLSLPTAGENGSTITWSSSDTNYLKPTTGTEIPTTRLSSDTGYSNPTTGTVTRPTVEEGDQTVTLTAILSNGGITKAKEFTVTIKIPDADMVTLDSEWLTDKMILNGNGSWNEVISKLSMPSTGASGSNIEWTSSNGDIIAVDGTVNRPAYPAEPAVVTLSATIFMGDKSVTKTFLAKVMPADATDSERMWEAYNALEVTNLLNDNIGLNDIMTDLSLPLIGLHESTISWSSSHPDIIAQTGTVTRPAFLAGDAPVTLTATITIETESVTKPFTLTVKESEPTDQEAVDETVDWLTADEIKGTNLSLDQVTANLLLHTIGSYSTEIQWTSDNPLIVETNGTVICPSFTQGNMVVKLTAVIKRGASSITKEFNVTVLTLNSTDQEAVLKAWDLLKYVRILGENEDAQWVDNPLTLPPAGEEGTTITWRCRPEGYISTNPDTLGQLSPPSFTTGDVAVTLEAIIARGDQSLEKSFEVIVKAMPLTDEEAVTVDYNKLTIADTLGLNPSPFAVTENLVFSKTSLYGSRITYESSAPDVLCLSPGGEESIVGQVIRPGYEDSHREVKVTVTITKGSQQKVKVFAYTVLAMQDTIPPAPVSITPAHNTMDVAYNTKETIITFDEDIMPEDGTNFYGYSPKYLGITLNGSLMSDNYIVRFEGKKLIIVNRSGFMPGGKNEIFIPAGTVKDKSGNSMADDIDITYTVEERVVRNIRLASSVPANGAAQVPVGTEISFTFDTSDLTKGSNFNNIALMNEQYPSIPITCELENNKVTVSFKNGGSLQKGQVYMLLIPGGAVADRFLNQNETQLLSFVVSPETLRPTVVSTFPKQNETDVSVLQHIQVNYKDAVIRSGGQVRITDEATGQPVAFAIGDLRDFNTILDLIPIKPLAPNTRYKVVFTNDFVKTQIAPHEPAASDYTLTFTTGDDRLSIQSINPENFAWDVPVNDSIHLVFNQPVQQGPQSNSLSMTDSAGNKVGAFARYNGNTVEIKPLSIWLEPSEAYTLSIPAGVIADGEGNRNDSIAFTFTTGRSLDLSLGDSYTVIPSARYLVNKKITFGTAKLQDTFRKTGRKLVSCEWDFGDGKNASGLQADHIYTLAGNYTAKLTATDNKGIKYELTQPMSIRTLEAENIEMIVTPDKLQNLVREDEYIDPLDGLPGTRVYRVYVKNDGIYLPDEKIKVYLYKNGKKTKDMGTVTTQFSESGVPIGYFFFDYKNPSYLGNYELVFVYGNESLAESVQTVRRTVHVADQRKKQDLWVKPINALTGEPVNIYPYLEFQVDGVKKDGEKKKVGDTYYYVIRDLPTGLHSIKLIRSESRAHFSEAVDFWHTSSEEITVLPVQAVSPGISRVWAKLETGSGPIEISSNMAEYKTYIYIPAMPSPPPIRFNIDIDWNETQPGYFEMQYNGGTTRFYNPWFDFDPIDLYPGYKLLVRAVNPMGEASPWIDCKIATVDSPTNPYVWLTYVDGEYLAETDMIMGDNMAGQIEGLDGMPLLEHSQSFGSQSGLNVAYGAVKVSDGRLHMNMSFDAGGSYGKSKKKPKMVSVGYDIEAETGGHVYMIYDPAVGYWSLDAGEFYVKGDVSLYREKGKVIPVINLGAKGRVTIGTGMGGTLYIDSSPDAPAQYSGILYLEPYVKGEVYGGIEGLNVEGYVRGSVNTEVHIPTGYIKVVPELTSKITKTILFVTTTVFDETWSTSWDNGKNAVVPPKHFSLGGMMPDLTGENPSYQVIPRNYLLHDTEWLPSSSGKAKLMARDFRILSPDDRSLLKDNIYPYSEVQLVRKGKELVAIWTDDNPIRTDLNRTQLYSFTKTESGWSEAVKFDEDGTADFSPAATLAGDDVLVAWQDFDGIFTEEDIIGDKLDAILKKAEISVTNMTDAPEDSGFLTGDDYYDHSPVIASIGGQSAMVVWIKSDKTEKLDIPQGGEETSRLMYSVRDGENWSEAVALSEGMSLISDLSLISGNDSYLLLYTYDSDNDITSPEDNEIWARVYSKGAWEEPIRLTDNNVQDSNPRGIFRKGDEDKGDWFILWSQDEEYVYRQGLAGETLTAEPLKEVSGKTALTRGDDFIALVYQKGGDNNSRNLSALFYDLEKDIWSHEIPLITGPGYIRSFSPVFDEDGNLSLLYTHADIITETKDGAEYYVPSNNIRLMFSSYTHKHDLAMDENAGIVLSTENPIPETAVRVTCLLENKGDFAEMAKVTLYDGTPERGVKIGEAIPDQPIPARSSVHAIIEWIVPAEYKSEHNLYAVVTSTDKVVEADTTNNTSCLTVYTSDVELVEVQRESLAGYQYLVKPLIFNGGSVPLENIKVVLEHGKEEVASAVIEKLNPGEHANTSFVISTEGLREGGAGKYPMTVAVFLPEGIKENATDNNVLDFELDTKIIGLRAMNPADGQQLVGVNEPIMLEFNRLITEEGDYSDIKLTDRYLNPVPIEKAIDQNVLTITPVDSLQHSTQYTLVIPENAIGDSYGRSMKNSESLSFTTVSQNPVPVFSSPFSQAENVRMDAEVRIQYSEVIKVGPTFNGIYLEKDISNLKIPLAITINEQWLTLKPTRRLSDSTAYSVHIPRGAVKNINGEYQSVDYDFSFTTEIGPETPVEEPDSDPRSGVKPPATGELYLVSVFVYSLQGSNWSMNQDGFYTLDLTKRANLSDGVRITLSGAVFEQLLSAGLGLRIATEKGELTFPEQWIRNLTESEKQSESVIFTIAARNGNNQDVQADPSRVSGILNITVMVGGRPLIEFDDPITVVMPVGQEQIENGQRVIACRYDELTGKWVPLGGKADVDAGAITFRTGQFSDFAAFETLRSFSDVTAAWAKKPVETLASRGLISGKTEGVFDPAGNITRAELTAMVIRSLYVKPVTKTGRFSDVAFDTWYAENVETAVALGIMSGMDNSRFAPLDKMTREQLAAIAYRLIGYMQEKEPQALADYGFSDQKDIAAYAVNGANYLASNGIMVGSFGKFNPKACLTRQEAAVVLYRLLDHLGEI